MVNDISMSADIVAMFCRLQMNAKRDLPIRSSEMGVLIFTHKQNNSVTPMMISKFFKITKPSVTSMINSLIKSGYLIKTPSTKDNRSYNVSVTNKGKDLIESTYNEYVKTMELLKENMGSKEFNLFIQLMNKANKILGEEI